MRRAGRRQGPGGVGSIACIDLVGRAQARKPRAGRLERGNHRVAALEAVIGHRLDAAGLEEILGEGRACGEVGEACRDWRGKSSGARRSPRACGRRRRAALRTVRRAGFAGMVRLRQRSAEPARTSRTAAAISASSGNSLVPVSASSRRATAFSRSARTAATLLWINPCFERSASAAGRFDLLEQAPTRRRRACRSGPRCRRSRPPGR